MWLDDEALNDHFEQVKDRLKRGSQDDTYEDIPTAQNEFTKDLRRR